MDFASFVARFRRGRSKSRTLAAGALSGVCLPGGHERPRWQRVCCIFSEGPFHHRSLRSVEGAPNSMRLLPPMASTTCQPVLRSTGVCRCFSGTYITCDLTGLHGRAESRMVPLGLIGVGLREVADSPIEALAFAEVGRDLDAVAGAGVCAGQRPAAEVRIKDQLFRRHALYLRRALHISQLTPVVVATGSATKPAEEDVARSLHQALPGHHAVSSVLVGALWKIAFQDRGFRLLHLEEQRIIFVATLEQHDVVPGANAANSHHLPGHVHETVLVEQVTPVVLQGVS